MPTLPPSAEIRPRKCNKCARQFLCCPTETARCDNKAGKRAMANVLRNATLCIELWRGRWSGKVVCKQCDTPPSFFPRLPAGKRPAARQATTRPLIGSKRARPVTGGLPPVPKFLCAVCFDFFLFFFSLGKLFPPRPAKINLN